jgi:hypothetical protein
MIWKLSVHGHDATNSDTLLMPEIVDLGITRTITSLETLSVCPGHPDPHFVDMA